MQGSRAVEKTERTKFSRKQDQERQGRKRIPDPIDPPIDLKAIHTSGDALLQDLDEQDLNDLDELYSLSDLAEEDFPSLVRTLNDY